MSTRQSHPSSDRLARPSPSHGFQRSAFALAIAAPFSASAYARDAGLAFVAEDIGKPLDANVADALQRVTGVQRNVREGNGIVIRDLTLVRSVEGCGAVRVQNCEQIC